MELDLLPRRNPNLDAADDLPEGTTHPEDEPCPFDHDFPIGQRSTCCSCSGQVAAMYLDRLGEGEVARLISEDLSAGAASAFALVLRSAVLRIEQRYPARMEKSKGAMHSEGSGLETGNPDLLEPSFGKALALIRRTADWYEKIGRLGFDVLARY